MLSGGPTPLWAQLRTFKHIKISQALHCPDYCLNIICFYIPSLPLWLIFPLKLYPSVMIFFLSRSHSLSGGFRVGRVSISTFHAKILSRQVSHAYSAFSLQSASHCGGHKHTHTPVTLTSLDVHPRPLALLFSLTIRLDKDVLCV